MTGAGFWALLARNIGPAVSSIARAYFDIARDKVRGRRG